MKAVLISIQPKWVEKIVSGEKTVEVRKTRPKCEVPFKCYIYCTKGKLKDLGNIGDEIYQNRMKVIGEFVCDRIDNGILAKSDFIDTVNIRYNETHVSLNELSKYLDADGVLGMFEFYGWHISDLVIYDKPRELSEFYVEGDCDCMNCKKCHWFDRGNGYNVEDDCALAYKGAGMHKSFKPIIRPPQSFCYVERRNENG